MATEQTGRRAKGKGERARPRERAALTFAVPKVARMRAVSRRVDERVALKQHVRPVVLCHKHAP